MDPLPHLPQGGRRIRTVVRLRSPVPAVSPRSGRSIRGVQSIAERKAHYGQWMNTPFVALRKDSLEMSNIQYVLDPMSVNFSLSSSARALSI